MKSLNLLLGFLYSTFVDVVGVVFVLLDVLVTELALFKILDMFNIWLEKVDKEEGKLLVDAEYADGVHYIENPEFVEVKLDSENKRNSNRRFAWKRTYKA